MKIMVYFRFAIILVDFHMYFFHMKILIKKKFKLEVSNQEVVFVFGVTRLIAEKLQPNLDMFHNALSFIKLSLYLKECLTQ